MFPMVVLFLLLIVHTHTLDLDNITFLLSIRVVSNSICIDNVKYDYIALFRFYFLHGTPRPGRGI